MGRMASDPRINHFSHRHPLELVSLEQSPQLTPATCAGCTFRASGRVYSCQPCRYILHLSCAEMPRRIRHPAHPDHSLTLLAVPAYKEGSFRCDACGRNGTGFSYHCDPCGDGGGVDFHSQCAAMPLSVSHAAHEHQLGLVFAAPYEDGGFACDLCGDAGANHWLYHCASCDFDAHIGCATAKSSVPAVPQQPRDQLPLPSRQDMQRRPRPPVTMQSGAQVRRPMGAGVMPVNYGAWQARPVAVGGMQQQQQVTMMNGAGRGTGGGGGGMVDQMLQNLVNSTTQQMGQMLVQNIFGVGGGDGGGASGSGDGGASIMDVAAGIFTDSSDE